MNAPKKIQSLVIRQLMNQGSVMLVLPDGVQLEIGITQEDQFGGVQKTENYCYVRASKERRSVMLDSFNLGLQFESKDNTIIYEDEDFDEDGILVKSLDVV